MPSRVITATVTSGSNTDKKGGTYVTFGSITSDSGTVSNAKVTSASLYLSNFKTYSSSFYLDVIFGGSGGTTVAETSNLDSNSTVHSSTESLTNLSALLLTSSVSTITLGVVATSGTGNKINIRTGCTLTLTINYQVNTTPCSAPTSVSVSPTTVDAGASATLSWSGAKAGTGNPINCYSIYRSTSAGSGYTFIQNVANTASSAAVTAPNSMGSTYYFKVAVVDTTDGMTTLSSVYAALTAKTYTACTAPSSLSVSSNNVAPGASITLSWSGAAAGTNNAISGYQIYRAASANGAYSLLTNVNTTSGSGSVSVTAPTVNGSSYYYKVLTVGTKSGYSSAQSGQYVALTCSFSAPTAPSNVTIDGGTDAYALAGATVTLSWSGAKAGTNNAVAGYDILQNGNTYISGLNANISSQTVAAHGTPGSSYTYAVVTKGIHSNSGASSGRSIYTYSHPTSPDYIGLSTPEPDVSTEVTLSWGGAKAGSYNAIISYQIYRAEKADGPYSLLTTVSSSASSASCSITAPDAMGSSFYYKVATVGERSTSDLSYIYGAVTTKVYTACACPSQISLSADIAEDELTIQWSGAEPGTNNPIAGYRISCQDSNDHIRWDAIQEVRVISSSATGGTLTVAPPDVRGHYRRFLIQTLGTAAGFDSEQTISTSVCKNQLPIMPVFLSGTVTYSQSPTLRIHMENEPDGQSQVLMLSVDDGDYSITSEETVLQNLAFGGHIIRAYSVDALGACSSIAELHLEVKRSSFTDPILTPGQTFVKAIHMIELRERINELITYYDLAPFLWSPAPIAGETGLVSWLDHVLELRSALETVYASLSLDAPIWTELPVNCPRAAAIEELREAIQTL